MQTLAGVVGYSATIKGVAIRKSLGTNGLVVCSVPCNQRVAGSNLPKATAQQPLKHVFAHISYEVSRSPTFGLRMSKIVPYKVTKYRCTKAFKSVKRVF